MGKFGSKFEYLVHWEGLKTDPLLKSRVYDSYHYTGDWRLRLQRDKGNLLSPLEIFVEALG
jgi:hypothetical protein